jgi:hypothetical protein
MSFTLTPAGDVLAHDVILAAQACVPSGRKIVVDVDLEK